MPEPQQQNESTPINLDGLIARYGRVIAQANLEAEVALQRAQRAEAAVEELASRVAVLEHEAERDVDPDDVE